jgi:hypothetical protein
MGRDELGNLRKPVEVDIKTLQVTDILGTAATFSNH